MLFACDLFCNITESEKSFIINSRIIKRASTRFEEEIRKQVTNSLKYNTTRHSIKRLASSITAVLKVFSERRNLFFCDKNDIK